MTLSSEPSRQFDKLHSVKGKTVLSETHTEDHAASQGDAKFALVLCLSYPPSFGQLRIISIPV